tara:strand:- start:351 stop:752 length:402 start_codon:yes stop_codon:yes gene_type:complete
MPKEKKANSFVPFSLRLSQEERERLKRDAGDQPLGVYIRSMLFDKPDTRQRRLKAPVKDQKALAQVLAKLGRSDISQNLKILTQAMDSGSLIVSPDTEEIMREASKALLEMRDNLLQALDRRSGGKNDNDAGG